MMCAHVRTENAGREILRLWLPPIAALAWCTVGCATSVGGIETVDASLTSALCGDGAVADTEGCDDGNLLDGDGCDGACEVERGWRCEGEPSSCVNLCGNGEVDDGEECDGDALSGHTCESLEGPGTTGELACSAQCLFDTTACIPPGCGNGVIDGNEECDDGNTSNQDACLNNCHDGVCGDGYRWVGVEECDDGNTSNQDACLNSCDEATCGDGYRWMAEEECDDGDTTSGDGCSSSCVLEYCGDGVVQSGLGEECEGGVVSCGTSCGSTGQKSCQSSCKWGICVPPAESCNAADEDCDGTVDMMSCLSTVYRFYNPSTGDHMFKVNDTTPEAGYISETFNHWLVYSSQVPGTAPIYQMSNGTDHMLSQDPTEGTGVGYHLESTIGYAASGEGWTAAGLAMSRICRYYNPSSGDHFAYLETVVDGYQKEGCPFLVWGFQ